MAGVSIGWNNNAPASTESVGKGDDELRSFKSNVQGGLAGEHLFPAAGGYAGTHNRGSTRVFVGTASALSSADTSGRLMATSDTSRLYYVGSESTVYRVGDVLTPEVRSWRNSSARSLSNTSGWMISARTMLVKDHPTSQGIWSMPVGSFAFITVGQDSLGSSTNAFCTMKMDGSSGGVPSIYPWNADGSIYSGDTLVCHLIMASTEAL